MTLSLFGDSVTGEPKAGQSAPFQPLASRMRPRNLDEYIGQDHLLGEGKPLRIAVEKQLLHSMILWGPPGVGKTSFARLLATHFDAEFVSISAVLSGVKDIRTAVERAKLLKLEQKRETILFVDEVHRFNKSQQDAFLPFVEDGTIVFVGATTENPSFELNNALLSRSRTYILKNLSDESLAELARNAIEDERGLASLNVECDDELLSKLSRSCNGDARRCLNLLELAVDLAFDDNNQKAVISNEILDQVMQGTLKRFDKGGDSFYEQISALHKSVRGSDPDGALYWFVRMIDGGCDPLYIARRLVRMASEDIGNADPKALTLALSAWDVQERLGSPEGELSVAQAVLYLAVAPKSNAVYKAYNQCRSMVSSSPDYDVPMHLRNAPTNLMKEKDFGKGYRYAHDEPGAFAAGEVYLPEELASERFYDPVDRGLEIRISQKLEDLRKRNVSAENKRYSR